MPGPDDKTPPPSPGTVVLQGWPNGEDVADFDDQGNLHLFLRVNEEPPAKGAWLPAHVVEKLRVVLNERASAPTLAAELDEAVGLLREATGVLAEIAPLFADNDTPAHLKLETVLALLRRAFPRQKVAAFLARHPVKET